jgi:hypothetical protein
LAYFPVLLLLGIGMLCGKSRAAPRNLVLPNVIGFWSGDYVSDIGPGAVASLDITDQDRRRFVGTFVFFPPTPIVPPNPCFVRGTVSRSGEISMVGRNAGVFLRARGNVFRGAMQLDYSLNFADGSFDTGTVAVSIETGTGT